MKLCVMLVKMVSILQLIRSRALLILPIVLNMLIASVPNVNLYGIKVPMDWPALLMSIIVISMKMALVHTVSPTILSQMMDPSVFQHWSQFLAVSLKEITNVLLAMQLITFLETN